jgi:hypothetical protein
MEVECRALLSHNRYHRYSRYDRYEEGVIYGCPRDVGTAIHRTPRRVPHNIVSGLHLSPVLAYKGVAGAGRHPPC